MNKIAKITAKVLGRIGLGLLGVLILLLLAVNSSFLQTRLANQWLARQLAETEATARVQSVNIDFILRQVKLTGIVVYDHHRNLLFDVGTARTSFRSLVNRELTLGPIYVSDLALKIHRYEEDTINNLTYFLNSLPIPQANLAFRTSALFMRNAYFSNVDAIESKGDAFPFIDFRNLSLNNINITARDVSVRDGNVWATMENMSFKEHKGFEVWGLSTRLNLSQAGIIARGTTLITSNSDLDLDLRFAPAEPWTFRGFVTGVRIYANFRDSYLNFDDLIYFAPGLDGKNNQFRILSGSILGHVSDFRAHNFNVMYGQNTRFHGNIQMTGLTDFHRTFLDFSIQEFTSSPEDIDNFLLPNFNRIIVPDELHNLGMSSVSGRITGFSSDLRADIDVKTEAGNIKTNFRFLHDTVQDFFDFSGQIEHANLALGRLLNDDALGNDLRMNGSFDGTFSAQNGIDLSTDMVIENIEYQNRNIEKMSVAGDWVRNQIAAAVSIVDGYGIADFSGNLSLDPQNIFLEASGSFYEFDLAEFVFADDRDFALLSFDFDGKVYNLNFDSLVGNLNFSNLSLELQDTLFRMNTLSLSQQILQEGVSTKIDCDYFRIEALGTHRLSNIDAIWDNILTNYLSALRLVVEDVELLANRENRPRNAPRNGQLKPPAQALELTLAVHKTGGFLSYFLPQIDLPHGADLRLKYNGDQQPLSLAIRANRATVYGFNVSFLDINGEVHDSVFEVNVDARHLHINDALNFEDFSAVARFENDYVLWDLDWGGNTRANRQVNGNLGGNMATLQDNRISLNIQNSDIPLGDQFWQFDSNSVVLIDPSGIYFENVRFFNQNDTLEYLSLNGDLSRMPNSVLELSFERYQLSPWMPLIERIGLDFDGAVSGSVSIFDFYTSVRFNTDLKIEDFSINAFNYGTAFLRSIADAREARSFISLSVQNYAKTYLFANGYFYALDDERKLDFNISVSDMDLSLLRNYVDGFSSALTGTFSGNLTLDGLLGRPNFYGDLTVDEAVMNIDFLNTRYAINLEKIAFSLDSIIFVNTQLTDLANGTQATLSGGLHHNRFNDFRLGIMINADNFLALNTTRANHDDFFGRVLFTGDVRLGGTTDDVIIDVQGRTERNTELQINHSTRFNLSEANQFIHFVVPERDESDETMFLTNGITTENLDVPTNILVRLNLDVTPDATVLFDMDAPPISGHIQARGTGNLRLNFDSRTREFTLFGDYTLQDGFYDFVVEDQALGLGQWVTRRFYIEPGGTLQWTGAPGNMILDVSAIYSTRASLAPVLADIQRATGGNPMRRVNVQSVISLAGRMANPDIRFDFRLPAIDEDTRTEFFSAINRDDENEMIRQTFSLLLFGGFMTPGDVSNLALVQNISAETMVLDALFNQVNNMLNLGSNISLSASYRPEDMHSTEQWQVSMGAQFLDNRLIIDGHIGQGGLSHTSSIENSTQTLMEVNIEYRITDRLSVQGFNRPNERDFSRGAGAVGYSQGVGIAYRREFGSFRLFNRRRNDD